MPPARQPLTLFKQSVSCFVKMFLEACNSLSDESYEKAQELQELLNSDIACTVIDTVVAEIIKLYVHQQKLRDHGCEFCYPTSKLKYVLPIVLSSNLSSLCLTKLACLGVVQNEEISWVEKILIQSFPSLKNLVSLSLKTHGKNITLPVCHDGMLEEIGKHCCKLKTLDVSYNPSVTDAGLKHLFPRGDTGCPHMQMICLYQCSVTANGVALALEKLPKLAFVGYKEIGQSLKIIYDRNTKAKQSERKLNITHVDNVGSRRTAADAHKLECTEKLASVIKFLCPKVQNLKVRVTDYDVGRLNVFEELHSVELMFNIGKPSSPGEGTRHFLQACGYQLHILALICNIFHTDQFRIIGSFCPNLKELWCRCNNLVCDSLLVANNHNYFTKLQTLYLRVGENEDEIVSLPHTVVSYLLVNTASLRDLILIMRNDAMCDIWLEKLLSSVRVEKLKRLFVVLPNKNNLPGAINLTMSSVEGIMQKCKSLEQLGNLLVWSISFEEVLAFERELNVRNVNLSIVHKIMIMK